MKGPAPVLAHPGDQEPCVPGWLVIDKPLGLSSFGVVARCKGILRNAYYEGKRFPLKIGHGGTLDPLATGVLPIALGCATKTISMVMDATKTYVFEVKWGEERLTDDAEGEVTRTCLSRPDKREILEALEHFQGTILQRPPLFCALKVNGRRAYKSAREGHTVILKERLVDIHGLSLLKCTQESACFEIECGKGFYIRALARDLAHFLGTCGYVASLRRTRVGSFSTDNAISLDNLERLGHKITSQILPFDVLLDDIPALHVDQDQAKRLYQGQTIRGCWEGKSGVPHEGEEVVVIKSQGQTLGMGTLRRSQGFLHLSRGFKGV